MVGGEEVGGRLQESLGRRGGHHDVAPQQLLLLGERLEGGQPGQALEAGGKGEALVALGEAQVGGQLLVVSAVITILQKTV